MPVKVRCQSCEKVFAAPDAARGKLVKCPGCEKKVKVPAGDGAKSGTTAKPAGKKPAPAKAKKDEHHDDHEHALKNLDLDGAEDENTRVCPKCGQEIYEEEVNECPACGLNFETGLTKEKQKGIDPKLFFRVVIKDSKRFLLENKPLAIRTGVYTLIFSVLNFCCLFMVTWCVSFPPRMFWLGLLFVTSMVPNGWLWFLNGEIIKATMEKRENMPRVNFDMFTCVALGIKYWVWRIVMALQLFFLTMPAGYFNSRQMWFPALALQAVFELILVLMIPQVMVHMTMPVTTRGWLMHIQFQAWAKSFGACLYWAAITFVVMLPSLVPVGLAVVIGRQGTIEFAAAMTHNYRANAQLGADRAAYIAEKNLGKKEIPVEVKEDDEKYKTRPLPWKGFIIPAIGLLLSQGMFGFGAVFAMRANGLLGLYYKKHLKLDTMAKDVVWMPNDPTVPKRKSAMFIIKTGAASIVCAPPLWGVKWMMGDESGNLYALASAGAVVLGIVILAIGGIMLATANAQRDKLLKQLAKAAKK